MIFRFTPVVLFLFLSALITVSSFLLWASYKNTQNALQYEQLEQVKRTHDLAELYLNSRLEEGVRTLETLSEFPLHDGNLLFTENTLKASPWSYVLRFTQSENGDLEIAERYGELTDQSSKLLYKNRIWIVENTDKGPALAFQFISVSNKANNKKKRHVFKAGIYLENNTPLISDMRRASEGDAHYLIYKERILASSVSLENGVSAVGEKVLETRDPVYPNLTNVFSGDMLPIKLARGTRELYLISVTLTDGTQSWTDSFKDSIILGGQFVVIVAVLVTFVIHYLTQNSLNRLTGFAKAVAKGEGDVEYRSGSVREFNEVGGIIEQVVQHVSEQGRYISNLVESAKSPIVAWDKDGKITIFNKSAQELYDGSGTEQFNTLDDFLRATMSPALNRACEMANQGEKVGQIETQLNILGQGNFILWSIASFKDLQGHPAGAIAQGQDITERRIAEKRLRLSSKVFDSTAEGIMITDENALIIDVNASFCDITGYAREEVIGHNPRIMKSGRHSKEFYKEMWETLLERGIWRGEVWDKRRNGEIFPKWLSISASRNESGRLTNYVAVFSDISEKKQDQEKLEQLAHFDPLTELPNRVLFNDRLYTALARSKREQEHLALLFVDLDKFKQVNDSLGHRVGDLLLKEVARRLQHSVREIDTVARLSGDEFTVILTDIVNTEAIEQIATRIVKSVGAPYFFEGHELFVSASVGIAVSPTDGNTSADLLRNADVAMYHAKEKGRNNYQFFDVGMNDHAQNQLSMANKLRIAINRDQITPHYQLKVDSVTGHPVGLEALARWTDDHGKMISPGLFIPVAEEHGLITRIGTSILQQCCAQARMWKDMGFDFGTIAINLSAQQFRDRNLISDIREAMNDHQVPPSLLEVEVTENMMMDDVEGAIQTLQDLKEMGLQISIDDFGTGYSSLSYLKRFPLDTLKIDRSFIKDIRPNSTDAAIVSAVVALAQQLQIKIVAEGVETVEQMEFLRNIGCNTIQGFLYAKPCPSGELPLVWQNVIDEYGK